MGIFVRCFMFALLSTFMLRQPRSPAEEIGFSFTGTVVQTSPTLGVDIALQTPVVGRFIYNLGSAPTHDLGDCDCTGYRQRIFGGFSATFGDFAVRSDDYLVEVFNDRLIINGNHVDAINILYANNLTPPLEKPFIVEGIEYEVGKFGIFFVDNDGSALSDSLPPSTISRTAFENAVAVLSDAPDEPGDVVALVAGLHQFPVLPGDFDWDVDVDGADFLEWQRTLGSSSDLMADGDRNGIVDAVDVTLWLDNFGRDENASAIALPAAVPEPATAHLLALMAILGTVVRSYCWKARLRSATPATRTNTRQAFTLVELLIVVAIVTILIALLLPAAQAAREAARRSSCQNRLRQVVLGLLNYEGSHRELPVGARSYAAPGSTATSHGVSWWVDVTPYLEHRALYEQFDANAPSSGWALLHPANGQIVDGVIIDAMLCPSSSLPPLWPMGGFQLMMPSFVGIAGATSHDGFPEQRVNTCCPPINDGEISGGGLLVSNSSISFKETLDGTSHVILVGESSDFVVSAKGTLHRIDGGFPDGWIMGTKAAGTPPAYGGAALVPSWNITTIRYGIDTRNYDLPGIYNNRGPNNPLVSPHPGGLHAAFADGSIQFLPSAMEVLTLKQIATRDDGELAKEF